MSLSDLKISPRQSPYYNQHREVSVAHDTLPEIVKAHGINMSSYRYGMVQVVPSGDADPEVEVFWWSEAAVKYVVNNPPLTYAGVGPNMPYEFTIETLGRIMFVAVVSGNNAGSNLTQIFVSGDVLRPQ